jgi:multidrug resistance protein, MATE family
MNRFRFAPTLRDILHLAWPVLVSQVALVANGVIDTVMAGRLGAVELAGVGIGAAIVMTVMVTCSGVLLALTPIIAHLHGAGRSADIGEEVRQSLWVALGLSLLGIALLRFPAPFLDIAHLQPEVEERARAYLAASSWSIPGLMLFRVFSGLSTGIGEPRAVMRFNLFGLLFKIPLNLAFVPFFGGAGCAMSSAVIHSLNALLAWRWCERDARYREFRIFTRFSRPRWSALREILRIGVPSGLTFLVDVTAFTFMALFIARFGAAASGAHQIASNLTILIFMLPMALGNAASVLIGRALGAGDPPLARHVGTVCLRAAAGLGLVVCFVLLFGKALIAHAYTNDPAVYAIAVPLIALIAAYHVADALQCCAVSILRGYKRTTAPMIIYAVALWGIGLCGGYYLGILHGMEARGFWIAAIASLAVAGAMMTAYFLRVSRPEPRSDSGTAGAQPRP